MLLFNLMARVLARLGETPKLFDRPAGHRRQFTHQPIRQLPGDRHLAVALELLDRRLGVGADIAGRLELAVAEFGQCALHGRDAARRVDQIAERIAATIAGRHRRGRARLRRRCDRGGRRHRGRRCGGRGWRRRGGELGRAGEQIGVAGRRFDRTRPRQRARHRRQRRRRHRGAEHRRRMAAGLHHQRVDDDGDHGGGREHRGDQILRAVQQHAHHRTARVVGLNRQRLGAARLEGELCESS